MKKPFIAKSIKEAVEELQRKVNNNDNQLVIVDEAIEQKGMSKSGISINEILKEQKKDLTHLKKIGPKGKLLEDIRELKKLT